MVGKEKLGRQVSIYLPYERIEQIERVKGDYVTTSKFVLWCLVQVLDNLRIENKENVPPGAMVSSPAPSGQDSSVLTKAQTTSSPGGVA